MPHQNVQSPKATAQNAATPSSVPNDQAREQHRTIRRDPNAYAAPDWADASVAPPAAGELADYADEGPAMGADGQQQGRTHTRRPVPTEAKRGQGPKTLKGNRQRLISGAARKGE